ncbi:MAG: methyltransferase domain-containing protein, partial [Candidatus Brocadiaceae bacterium]|nr:methyltransferase domain-containing protein [Candidatus Brocadiaceae bacterium]
VTSLMVFSIFTNPIYIADFKSLLYTLQHVNWEHLIYLNGLSFSFIIVEDKEIKAQVQARFRRISVEPSSEKRVPIGPESAKNLGYNPQEIDSLPPSVTESFAGVGYPLGLGPIHAGERVLDIGSGAGLDAFLVSRRVGPTGRVIGVDMTPEMVEKAEANRQRLGVNNVEFHQGLAEELPVGDNSMDLVIFNGLVNLSPQKERVLAEVYRVLRPGGRIYAADIILEEGVDQATVEKLGQWSN